MKMVPLCYAEKLIIISSTHIKENGCKNENWGVLTPKIILWMRSMVYIEHCVKNQRQNPLRFFVTSNFSKNEEKNSVTF